ncbi:unnamed protein product [Symbiodinium sp. KB8]|nr:unnamed protein product [Symbiodinium sp. KB8]
MSPFTKNDRDETMDSLKTPQKMHRSTDGSHLLQSDVKTGSRRASPSGDFTNSEVSVLFRRGDSTVSALREILQEHEGMESYSDVVAGQPESEESRGASANNFEETKAESGADASESEGEGSGSLLVDTRYGRIMLGAGEKAKRHALAMRQRGQDSVSASVDPSAAVGEVEGITSVLDAGGLTSYANVPPSLSAIYRVSNNNRNKPKDRKKVVDANLDIDAIANDERLTESARATLRIAATGDDDSGRRGSVTSTTSVNDKVPSAASSSVQFLRKIGWIGESEQPDLLPVRRDDIGSDGGSGNEGSVKSKDRKVAAEAVMIAAAATAPGVGLAEM